MKGQFELSEQATAMIENMTHCVTRGETASLTWKERDAEYQEAENYLKALIQLLKAERLRLVLG